jgi:membrane-associated phospholipid phosphatase
MARVSFDNHVMQAVADHRAAWATAVAKATTTVGTTPVVLVGCVLVAGAVVVALRAYRTALAALLALVMAVVAADVLKHVFGRPRPPRHLALVWVSGDAFPSTHAAATSAIAVAVLVAFPWPSARTARAAAVIAAVLLGFVGACMVYVGAHWPTDVLAGWVIGGTVGYVVGRAFRTATAPA